MKVTNSSEIEQALLTNQIDIGMIEGVVSDENLIAAPMCKDELVIVCGKAHPFAKKEKYFSKGVRGTKLRQQRKRKYRAESV